MGKTDWYKPQEGTFYTGEVMLLRKIRRAAFAVRFDRTEAKESELDALLTEYYEEWEKKWGKY